MRAKIHEAKTHLSKLLRLVIESKEVITKRGKPIAKLIPIEEKEPERKLGTAKGKVQIAPDFDEPLKDFKKYTQ